MATRTTLRLCLEPEKVLRKENNEEKWREGGEYKIGLNLIN